MSERSGPAGRKSTAGELSTSSGRHAATAKRDLRRSLLARRAARAAQAPADRAATGAALARVVLAAPEVAVTAAVAAYVSVGTEPPTLPLLEALHGRGTRVLLPVLLPGGGLDWAAYGGPATLRPAARGLLEPAGPRLGPDAVTAAEVGVVVVPALAVDRHGLRLGRGGGSYDRALARARPSAWTCALLYDGEVLDEVPAEPHDRPVQAAALPSGLVRFN